MTELIHKPELRRQLRGFLNTLTPDEVHRRSHRAIDRLLGTSVYQTASTVMVFISLPTEVDTTGLVLDCWQHGKRVVAPQVTYETRRMLPLEIHSFSDLHSDDLGIRQPISGEPVPFEQIDLVIVPGLGFDSAGQRIGRGGGFYDRFLSNPKLRATACGLAFEEQFVPNVPAGPLDQPVDMLVTDHEVRFFDAVPQG